MNDDPRTIRAARDTPTHITLRTKLSEPSDGWLINVSRDDLEKLLADRDMLNWVCYDYYCKREE